MSRPITRHGFLWATVGFVGLAVGCTGDEPAGDGTEGSDGGEGGDDGCEATIDANHLHALVIDAADIEAGIEREYDILGASDHSHLVTLTAADFEDLASGKTVIKVSSLGGAPLPPDNDPEGHPHEIEIRCV